MARFTIPLALEGDRARLRRDLASVFLEELPGTTKESYYYSYIVGTGVDGTVVEIVRPTWLNKGFDFAISVPTCSFCSPKGRWSTRPSHNHLCSILDALRRTYPDRFPHVQDGIRQAYRCEDLERSCFQVADMQVEGLDGIRGRIAGDIAVIVVRWMFIEQDITYWTHSGRAKLFGKLTDEGLL